MPVDDIRVTEKESAIAWRKVDSAIRYAQDRWHKDCERARKLYDGEHWPEMLVPSERPRIVVNYCKPTVETKVANIAFAYPDFRLKPLNKLGEASVKVAEQVIRYDWRQAGAQREARRALRDREIYGLGIVYDCWLWETEPADGEPGKHVEGGRPAEAVEPEDTTPDTNPEHPMETEPGEPPSLPETVRSDRPFVKRISPVNFFVDLEADAVLENAAFCGFCEYRPVDEVKRDRRYKNTQKLKGSSKSLKPWMDKDIRDKDDAEMPADVRRVKLMHMFEKATKRHWVFCDEHKKPLLSQQWGWEGDWYPFSVLRAPDDEDAFYPKPPLLWIEHQQREMNESRTQHSEWRRQNAPKYQCRTTLEEAARQRIASSQAGTVIENVGEPIALLPQGQLQPEVLQAASLALQDLRFIAGLNDYEQGQAPTKRMTGAEVEAVRMSGGSRGAADRQAFEMFCADIARHLLAWEKQYSVRSRTLPIFDRDENVTGFIDFTPEMIAGEYDVEVYVGSTTAPNPQDTLNGIGLLMQSLPPLLQAIPAAQQFGIDLMSLIPKLIKAALPEIRDADQMLMPQPMPGMAPGGLPGMMAGPPPEQGAMPMDEGAALAPDSAQAMLAAILGGGA